MQALLVSNRSLFLKSERLKCLRSHLSFSLCLQFQQGHVREGDGVGLQPTGPPPCRGHWNVAPIIKMKSMSSWLAVRIGARVGG